MKQSLSRACSLQLHMVSVITHISVFHIKNIVSQLRIRVQLFKANDDVS